MPVQWTNKHGGVRWQPEIVEAPDRVRTQQWICAMGYCIKEWSLGQDYAPVLYRFRWYAIMKERWRVWREDRRAGQEWFTV